MARHFTDLCTPFHYPCKRGDKYPDPCDCGKFYLCEHPTTIIHQSCSAGTLFNHETKSCEWTDDVAITGKLCDFHRPWERCAIVDPSSDIQHLKHRCAVENPSLGVYPTLSQQGQVGEATSNSGIIMGCVIGGLVLMLLIAILIIFIRRRRKPDRDYIGELNEVNIAGHKDNKVKNNQKETMVLEKKPERGSDGLNNSSPKLNLKATKNKRAGKVGHDNPGYTPYSHA